MSRYSSAGWLDMFYQIIFLALFGGIMGAGIVLMVASEVLPLVENYVCSTFILSALLISVAIYNLAGKWRYCIWKRVSVNEQMARQIIANVLEAKGLPYQETEKGFEIDPVTIYVGKGPMGWGRTEGTSIYIGPDRGANHLLVNSLKEDIDEAFLPRGIDR